MSLFAARVHGQGPLPITQRLGYSAALQAEFCQRQEEFKVHLPQPIASAPAPVVVHPLGIDEGDIGQEIPLVQVFSPQVAGQGIIVFCQPGQVLPPVTKAVKGHHVNPRVIGQGKEIAITFVKHVARVPSRAQLGLQCQPQTVDGVIKPGQPLARVLLIGPEEVGQPFCSCSSLFPLQQVGEEGFDFPGSPFGHVPVHQTTVGAVNSQLTQAVDSPPSCYGGGDRPTDTRRQFFEAVS